MRITSLPTGALGANTYIVVLEEEKKGLIVDPGGYNPKITEMINYEGVKVEYILLTHGHGDHIGGVDAFKKDFPNAKVVGAKEEEELFLDPEKNMSALIDEPISVKADILVSDNDVLPFGSLELKFLMTPGHSKGGMCIYVGNVVFSGDTLFANSVGRTDFPDASFPVLEKSIHDKIFTLPPETQVLPGHMQATTVGYEMENNPFVSLKKDGEDKNQGSPFNLFKS